MTEKELHERIRREEVEGIKRAEQALKERTEQIRKTVAETIKACAAEVVNRADDIAIGAETWRSLNISMNFAIDTVPELVVTTSLLPQIWTEKVSRGACSVWCSYDKPNWTGK